LVNGQSKVYWLAYGDGLYRLIFGLKVHSLSSADNSNSSRFRLIFSCFYNFRKKNPCIGHKIVLAFLPWNPVALEPINKFARFINFGGKGQILFIIPKNLQILRTVAASIRGPITSIIHKLALGFLANQKNTETALRDLLTPLSGKPLTLLRGG
jgi:hypothetical protein